jgi:hypothetical protein
VVVLIAIPARDAGAASGRTEVDTERG